MNFTQEQVDQMIAAKLAEQAKLLEKAHAKPFGLKISEKGAVSVYGIGRFPVTLYASQWERLFSEAERVKEFITKNSDKVAVKGAMVANP